MSKYERNSHLFIGAERRHYHYQFGQVFEIYRLIRISYYSFPAWQNSVVILSFPSCRTKIWFGHTEYSSPGKIFIIIRYNGKPRLIGDEIDHTYHAPILII